MPHFIARHRAHSLAKTPLPAALTLLTFLALALTLPAFHLSTHATSASTTVSVAVRPVLSIAIGSDQLALDLVQSPDGTFGAVSTSLSVATNAADGYSIYLYAADGDPDLKPTTASNATATTTTTSATSASASTTTTISPVAANSTPDTFGANTWGYSLAATSLATHPDLLPAPDPDTATYQPVSARADTVATSTSAPSSGDTYSLAFGANVTNDLAPDSYSGTVVVSVVANPAEASSLTELTFMQDISPAVCQNSPAGATKQLTDTRDGKKYWVAKLEDGNCWMLQNLDLDLDPARPLTPADSDVSRVWTPATATSTTIFNSNDETATLSYDPGLYLKSNPTAFNEYCTTSTSLADPSCQNVGFVDVSNRTAATTPDAELLTDQTYDAHYLVGNYYQWNAATAGTGVTTTAATAESDADAPDSICPRGWQLPVAGPDDNTTSGSFHELLGHYDLTTSSHNGAIASSPLYLQYSGYIYQGQIYQAGYTGRYWSSTVSPANHIAYSLYFSNSVAPTDYYFYFNGFPVRCLASTREL